MLATIRLDFDPSTSIFGLAIRLETLALAGAVFLSLVLAALISGRSTTAATTQDGNEIPTEPRLRRDDLILIAFGAVPGAVVGGRLGYALIHFDYYRVDFTRIADPAQGGYSLTLAVVLGTLTAIAVGRILAAPIDRWLGVATLPVLLLLGLGKLAMILGGSGQGNYSDASGATTYVGPGLWGSINPSFAAVPSQALEGGVVLAVAVAVLALPFLLRIRIRRWAWLARPGLAPRREWGFLTGRRRYMTAIGAWAVVRFAVAFTWRDAHVLGPFVADQFGLLLVAVAAFFGPEALAGARRARVAVASRRAARRAERREARAAQASAVTEAVVAADAPAAEAPSATEGSAADGNGSGEAAQPTG